MGIHFERFDMSEYSEDFTVSKLIGSPAGYVGHEDGGLLTNAISKNPVLNIYNLAGQVVLSENIKSANQFVDVFKLTSGYYIYEISIKGMSNVRDKLIVLPN